MATSITDRILPPEASTFFKGLLFGPPGAGKTHFVGTAGNDSRTSPVLVIDFDNGGSTLRGAPNVYRLWARDWQDYNEIYRYLKNDSHPYKMVAIDSISETHLYALFNIVDADMKKNSKRADRNEIFQGDYGKALTQMRRLLREFRLLPNVHLVFTALAKNEIDPKEGTVRKPMLAGTLAEEVVGMFDISAFYSMSREKLDNGTIVNHRRLILGNTPGIRAKSRSGWNVVLPSELLDPTMTTLFDTLGIT